MAKISLLSSSLSSVGGESPAPLLLSSLLVEDGEHTPSSAPFCWLEVVVFGRLADGRVATSRCSYSKCLRPLCREREGEGGEKEREREDGERERERERERESR